MPDANPPASDPPFHEIAHQNQLERKDQRSIHLINAQPASRLFLLPTELRAHIWELILPRSITCYARGDNDDHDDGPHGTNIAEYPIVPWEKGCLEIFGVCKRINEEAVQTFWRSNTFTLVIDGPDPWIDIWYTGKDAVTQGQAKSERKKKRLSTVKKEEAELAGSWIVVFPTHWGLHFDQHKAVWRAGEEEMMRSLGGIEALCALATSDLMQQEFGRWFARWCAGLSRERREYRQKAMQGMQLWIECGGIRPQRRLDVILAYQSYVHFSREQTGPDPKLKMEVEALLRGQNSNVIYLSESRAQKA